MLKITKIYSPSSYQTQNSKTYHLIFIQQKIKNTSINYKEEFMRILIVSCSKSTTEPYFLQVSSLILKIINTQNTISDTELVVVQRHSDNLTDYLYQLDTSHITPSAIHNFEAIDLFFIVGNRNIHPWNQSMWNINCLIRMCLRLKRNLMLISGCVFESLVFQLSCGFIGNVSLINKSIGPNIKQVSESIKPLKKTDLFLDEIEGILYAFNFQTNEWYKKRDCGLKNHHKLEEVSRKSRYLIVRKKTPNLSMTKNIEEQCSISMNHSLFKNISTPFMVQYISKWRANPSNCNFKILAQTTMGPSIIQFENIIAIQFKLNSKYPSTIKTLQNFINSKLQNLFVDAKKGKIQSFLNRQEYDKPTLSVPLRRIDNTQCPLPKLEFMHRLKKSTAKDKPLTRSKILSQKSDSNFFCENSKPSQQWWQGTRVRVPTKKPLFYSKVYQQIKREHRNFRSSNKVAPGKTRKEKQQSFINFPKAQHSQFGIQFRQNEFEDISINQ